MHRRSCDMLTIEVSGKVKSGKSTVGQLIAKTLEARGFCVQLDDNEHIEMFEDINERVESVKKEEIVIRFKRNAKDEI
jgi:deoxyadenosine/deoxycytidine kinase